MAEIVVALPEIVEPFVGEVIETVGGVTSVEPVGAGQAAKLQVGGLIRNTVEPSEQV